MRKGRRERKGTHAQVWREGKHTAQSTWPYNRSDKQSKRKEITLIYEMEGSKGAHNGEGRGIASGGKSAQEEEGRTSRLIAMMSVSPNRFYCPNNVCEIIFCVHRLLGLLSHRLIRLYTGTTSLLPAPLICASLYSTSVQYLEGSLRNGSEEMAPIIPKDKVEARFSRSSGAGGQNVNKVNTKAEIRFNLDDAVWLSAEVKSRLEKQNPAHVSKSREFIVVSQRHRT